MTERTNLSIEVPTELAGPAGGELYLVVSGIEQRGPSHELRVFACNPLADASTARTADNGYLGSIFVYGYGLDEPDSAGEAGGAGGSDAADGASAAGAAGGVDSPPGSPAALPMERALRVRDDAWPPRGWQPGAHLDLTFVTVQPGQASGAPGPGPRVSHARLTKRGSRP